MPACRHYGKALETQREALGEKHPNVGTTCSNMGAVYFALRQYAPGPTLWRVGRESRIGSELRRNTRAGGRIEYGRNGVSECKFY